ncbi:MAG: hypothetical protein RBS19_05495 [Bacteroidales bacterium]|nr:hypothetical protein [Bacteroidales bacterium]
MIRKFFQQDNIFLGIGLGILLPSVLYGLFWIIFHVILANITADKEIIKTSTVQLICIFSNLATIRYYLLRLKFDRTGRGILLSTMILAIVYFAIYI